MRISSTGPHAVSGTPGFRIAGIWESGIMGIAMAVVRLGKKGQVSLPKAVLRRLGLTSEALLLVEVTPEGGILLRPAGVYPIELYSEQRVREFLAEDRLGPREARRLKGRIRKTS
jgi:AbrB family looped-hinge helix DNA binding protein